MKVDGIDIVIETYSAEDMGQANYQQRNRLMAYYQEIEPLL